MKKIFAISIMLLTLLATGCTKKEPQDDTENDIYSSNRYGYRYGTTTNSYHTNNSSPQMFEWISPDGVHYWVYDGAAQYGMAPRYDNNGNLVIDEEQQQ